MQGQRLRELQPGVERWNMMQEMVGSVDQKEGVEVGPLLQGVI